MRGAVPHALELYPLKACSPHASEQALLPLPALERTADESLSESGGKSGDCLASLGCLPPAALSTGSLALSSL